MMSTWTPWPRRKYELLSRYVHAESVRACISREFFSRAALAQGCDTVAEVISSRGAACAVRVLYEALRQRRIDYTMEPLLLAEADAALQRIRTPAEILRTRYGEATCLDLAVLLASLCLRFRLAPYVILLHREDGQDSHALLGVDLTVDAERWCESAILPGTWANGVDRTAATITALRAAVAGKQLLLIDPSGCARRAGQNSVRALTWDEALESGQRWLGSSAIEVVVNVAASHAADDANARYLPVSARPRKISDDEVEESTVEYAESLALTVRAERTWCGKSIRYDREYVSLHLVERADASEASQEFLVLSNEQLRRVESATLLQCRGSVLLVGGPGTGKSTLLRHWVLKLCDGCIAQPDSAVVPFFLRLKECADLSLPLEADLKRALAERITVPARADALLKRWLASGQISVHLDAYDEIGRDHEGVLGKVIKFASRHANVKIVLASRPLRHELTRLAETRRGKFHEVAIAPLDLHQQREFIDCYLKSGSAGELALLIDDSSFLRSIAVVPIYLELTICLYEERALDRGARRPLRRAGFYQDAATLLLQSWPQKRGWSLKHSTPAMTRLLGWLCWMGLVRGRFMNATLVAEAGAHISEAESIFREVVEASGLLVPIRRGYQCLHRTFMEYFAGVEIVANSPLREEDIAFLLDRRNAEVLAFVAGLLEDPSALLRRIVAEGDAYLAAVVLSECASADERILAQAERLIMRCVTHEQRLYNPSADGHRILRLLHLLHGSQRPEGLYPRVLRMLSAPAEFVDPSSERLRNAVAVQTEALRYLVHCRDNQATNVLIEALLSDEVDTWIRFKTAAALANVPSEHLISSLKKAYDRELSADGDEDVRVTIVECMVRSARADSRDVLAGITETDGNALIRALAQSGVGRIDEGGDNTASVHTEKDDPDFAAVRRLYLSNVLTSEDLLREALHGSASRRLGAFFRLRDFGPRCDLHALNALLNDPAQEEIFRCEIVKLMGSAADPLATRMLLNYFLKFSADRAELNQYSRGYAVEYLGYSRSFQSLREVLSDPHLTCRPSGEISKAMWSTKELLELMPVKQRRAHQELVFRALVPLRSIRHERLQHWISTSLGFFDPTTA